MAVSVILSQHSRPAAAALSPAFLASTPTPVVYVAQSDQGEVVGYPSNFVSPLMSGLSPAPPPVVTINGLQKPSALAVDAAGNLYIAETSDIKVFAPGSVRSRSMRSGPSTL